jgi:hypothetical protein
MPRSKKGQFQKGNVPPKFKDLTGLRVNHLTVVSREPNRNFASYWLCLCDCGATAVVSCNELKAGQKTCGKCGLSNRLSKKDSAINDLIYGYKQNSKSRKVSFLLTREQFSVLILNPCMYCGSLPSNKLLVGKKAGVFLYNGIDRKDNKKDYTLENCVSCCKMCNFAKRDVDHQEFLTWIKSIKFPPISIEQIRSWNPKFAEAKGLIPLES